MTTHRDYEGRSVGMAKVINEAPYSDGSTALQILNFRRNDDGMLETFFRIMPLIHPAAPSGEAVADVPDAFSQNGGCKAIAYNTFEGGVPEILFLCGNGVYRYAPWATTAGVNTGLELQNYYPGNNAPGQIQSPTPVDRTFFPPQWESIGNRIYFTFADGAGAWVWDRDRIRSFGYTFQPAGPSAEGPMRDEADADNPNDGGFSVKGRVGSTEVDWTLSDPNRAGLFAKGDQPIVGGIDNGEWDYHLVLEGVDGNFSATSGKGGTVTIRLQMADPEGATDREYPQDLLRRFRVSNIMQAPQGSAARILLRSANKRRLPPGDDGSPRFLHRLIGDISDEWIDDIPDGELGPQWKHREVTPSGFYLLKAFAGSLWMMRTDGAPSRVWWSEQTNANGPTPESIMLGHWRDIFPNTGPINGSHEVQLGTDPPVPILMIGKEQAMHYVSGHYPDWRVGTLHRRAGLAGPNLIQTLPNGSVLWYGNRTFWMLSANGSITDVGVPIKKRLRRVNFAEAKMGSSFVDPRTGEAVFTLPLDGETTPNYSFVWDYELNGWRASNQMYIYQATQLPEMDMVLVTGKYDGETNVFIWDRASYDFDTTAGSKYGGTKAAVYKSGWVPMSSGPGGHSFYQLNQLIVTAQESQEGTLTLETFGNWDGTVATTTDTVSITQAHPEDDGIAFWDEGAVAANAPDDPAVLGTDLYRTARPYAVRAPIDIPSAEVCSIKLTVPASQWFTMVGMDIYGPKVAGPGGRTPTVAEDLE